MTPRRWRVRRAAVGASDTNYIFSDLRHQHLPAGLIGLVLAVVFGATMTAHFRGNERACDSHPR